MTGNMVKFLFLITLLLISVGDTKQFNISCEKVLKKVYSFLIYSTHNLKIWVGNSNPLHGIKRKTL